MTEPRFPCPDCGRLVSVEGERCVRSAELRQDPPSGEASVGAIPEGAAQKPDLYGMTRTLYPHGCRIPEPDNRSDWPTKPLKVTLLSVSPLRIGEAAPSGDRRPRDPITGT